MREWIKKTQQWHFVRGEPYGPPWSGIFEEEKRWSKKVAWLGCSGREGLVLENLS